MKTMNYTVLMKEMVQDHDGGKILNDFPVKDVQISTKKLAVATARAWAEQNPTKYIFIHHFENHDGIETYLNTNGFDNVGRDWAAKYKEEWNE